MEQCLRYIAFQKAKEDPEKTHEFLQYKDVSVKTLQELLGSSSKSTKKVLWKLLTHQEPKNTKGDKRGKITTKKLSKRLRKLHKQINKTNKK